MFFKVKGKENDIMCNQQILSEITQYLKTDLDVDSNLPIETQIKELCIKKLCETIGIKCNYNSQNIFFNFFSSIAGEAIVTKLHINIKVDELNLKCFKFNNFNLIYSAVYLLDYEDIDEAIIDIYDLADKFKWVLKKLA